MISPVNKISNDYNDMEIRGNYFKLPTDKRMRPIYNSKGNYTKAFKEIYKREFVADNKDLKFIYNEKTNRFIKKADMFDKRSNTKKLKKKYAKEYDLKENVITKKRTYYNQIEYYVYEFRGVETKKKGKKQTKLYLSQKTIRSNEFKTDRPFDIEKCVLVTKSEYLDARHLPVINQAFPNHNVYLQEHLGKDESRGSLENAFAGVMSSLVNFGEGGLPLSSNVYTTHPNLTVKAYDYEVIQIKKVSSELFDTSLKDLKELKMYNAQFLIENPHINQKFIDSG
jgi:hypothetical protein